MSQNMKQQFNTPEGQAHLQRMSKTLHTPETRVKMSQNMKQQFNTPEGQAHLQRIMSAARRKNTK